MLKKSGSGAVALARAAGLGVVTGLRSQTPMAFLARTAKEPVLSHPVTQWMTYFGAASELVIDKMPFTPSRLNPGSLGGRTVSGALAGGLILRRMDGCAIRGALVGGAGALAGSYAGYHLRKQLGDLTGLPDPLFAVLEDGIAITAAALLVRTGK